MFKIPVASFSRTPRSSRSRASPRSRVWATGPCPNIWLSRPCSARGHGLCSISAGRSPLARCLAGPTLVCVRECAHLTKAKQPRNLGYMQLAVLEVPNRQIVTQVLKYFSKVQPFVRELSCKRPLAHSQTASDVFHEHFSVRKYRRDCVLNLRAQLARWPAPGSEDTELGVLMEPEVGHGETEVYSRVQA